MKYKVMAKLKTLSVTLNKETERRKLMRGVMSNSQISVDLYESPKIKCEGMLGNLKLIDLAQADTHYREVFGLRQGKDSNTVLDFQMETFEKKQQQQRDDLLLPNNNKYDHPYPGHDAKISMQMKSVSMVYQQEVIMEVVDYLQAGLLQAIFS